MLLRLRPNPPLLTVDFATVPPTTHGAGLQQVDPTGESVTDGERKSQQRASFAETGLRTSMGIHGVFSYAKTDFSRGGDGSRALDAPQTATTTWRADRIV